MRDLDLCKTCCLYPDKRFEKRPLKTQNTKLKIPGLTYSKFKIRNCGTRIGVQCVVSRYEIWKAASQSVTNHTIFGAFRQNQFQSIGFLKSRKNLQISILSIPQSYSGWGQIASYKSYSKHKIQNTKHKITNATSHHIQIQKKIQNTKHKIQNTK